jgi:hypothetical protein
MKFKSMRERLTDFFQHSHALPAAFVIISAKSIFKVHGS